MSYFNETRKHRVSRWDHGLSPAKIRYPVQNISEPKPGTSYADLRPCPPFSSPARPAPQCRTAPSMPIDRAQQSLTEANRVGKGPESLGGARRAIRGRARRCHDRGEIRRSTSSVGLSRFERGAATHTGGDHPTPLFFQNMDILSTGVCFIMFDLSTFIGKDATWVYDLRI